MMDTLFNILLYIIPLRNIDYNNEKIIVESSFIQELKISEYNKLVDYYNKFHNITY